MDLLTDFWARVLAAWVELRADLFGAMPSDVEWPITVVSLLLLVLIGRVAGWNRRRYLARQMLQQIRDSNPHPIRVYRGPNADGFVVESNPAPEPFAQLMILYVPDSRLDPLGMIRWLLRRDAHSLRVRGMLHTPPRAELIWRRHSDPAAGLIAERGQRAWVLRTLDFNEAQYSTRGVDTAALEHVFADFQTRFGSILRHFVVRNEIQPQVEIALGAPRLMPLTVAGFLISLRNVGRAARS
ncbi:MAG: hypothetical protein WDZ49_07325 [Litorilinea sp.]